MSPPGRPKGEHRSAEHEGIQLSVDSSDFTFFWHDYETFGRTPRRDRPAQFAGVRTDAQLNEIEPPVMLYCKPAPDSLPEPEACLLTGITPQHCLQHGVSEAQFAQAIEEQLARPDTVGVGYNSIRFDDEVTRFLFWRNLIDPYSREYSNGCGRWDLMDAVRCAYALRPDGLQWPTHADGKPSFKLEDLTRANGLTHSSAHDALSDVRATIAMAKALKVAQPKLWEFCLRLRRKDEVLKEIGIGRPFLHISGRYPAERGCLAVVWPLAPHPRHKNEIIVWDLSEDPSALLSLNATQVRERLFVRQDQLPEGVARLPIKTIHLNRAPVVVGNLKTLSPAMAQRWSVDLDHALRHAEVAALQAPKLAGLWSEVFERPESQTSADVDEDLYGGFLSNDDRRALQSARGMTPEQMKERRPAFADDRLDELLFRYRARNHRGHLTADELQRWQAHCEGRLLRGEGGATTLAQFMDQVDALAENADERGQAILGDLMDYAASLAP